MKKALLLVVVFASTAPAQLTHERLLEADNEPESWLTYSGNYNSWRFSRLDQITRDNAHRLQVKWSIRCGTPKSKRRPSSSTESCTLPSLPTMSPRSTPKPDASSGDTDEVCQPMFALVAGRSTAALRCMRQALHGNARCAPRCPRR